MNIWGYKKRLERAREHLEKAESELSKEKFKKGRMRDFDKIEWWEKHVKDVKAGQQRLRDKIKILKQNKKKKIHSKK